MYRGSSLYTLTKLFRNKRLPTLWNEIKHTIKSPFISGKGITQNKCHFLRTAAWRPWNCKTHNFCESIGWIVQSLDHSDSQLTVSKLLVANRRFSNVCFGFVYSINQLDPTSLIYRQEGFSDSWFFFFIWCLLVPAALTCHFLQSWLLFSYLSATIAA